MSLFQNSLPQINIEEYQFNEELLSKETITELLTLHKYLVETPSVSTEEYNVAQSLANYLKHKGLTVEFQKVEEKRYNVLAYKGSINDKRIVLNSHIDTVPPFFLYRVEENGTKIFGRGSTDAKGSIASQVIAFLELSEEINDGDVSLLFTVGEETNGQGFRHSVANTTHKNWETVIIGEATEGKLGIVHKGVYHGTLRVTGLASHSGYPELGTDANLILIDVLHNLKKKELPSNELLGKSTINIGLIEGGVAGNIISPTATASLLFRVSSELEKFKGIVEESIKEQNLNDYVKFNESLGLNPVFFDHEINGLETILLGYGTDAFSLHNTSVQHKFLYGPGTIHVAHSAVEHAYVNDLIEAVDGYKKILKHSISL